MRKGRGSRGEGYWGSFLYPPLISEHFHSIQTGSILSKIDDVGFIWFVGNLE